MDEFTVANYWYRRGVFAGGFFVIAIIMLVVYLYARHVEDFYMKERSKMRVTPVTPEPQTKVQS